jgi:hypothetical protein
VATELVAQATDTEVTLTTGAVMAMVVIPLIAGFWMEVAVMVTYPEAGTLAGAVNAPLDEMPPALADQVTAEL